VDNVLSGLLQGGAEIGNGFVNGVRALYQEPVRGAENDGVRGAMFGVGKGLFSAVARPLEGVVTGAEKIGQGMVNSVQRF